MQSFLPRLFANISELSLTGNPVCLRHPLKGEVPKLPVDLSKTTGCVNLVCCHCCASCLQKNSISLNLFSDGKRDSVQLPKGNASILVENKLFQNPGCKLPTHHSCQPGCMRIVTGNKTERTFCCYSERSLPIHLHQRIVISCQY